MRSRPVRARGLKQRKPCPRIAGSGVAPRAGAWIETLPGNTHLCILAMSRPVRARGLKLQEPLLPCFHDDVAPRAGAWIETLQICSEPNSMYVAPRAGAWIETFKYATSGSST